MSNLKTLRTAIKAKFDSLTWTWQPLAVNYNYHTLDSDWQFPFVTYEPDTLESVVLDTCSNQRTYVFDCFIYQEITNEGREESLDILVNAFQDIIDAFDSDYTLWGAADLWLLINADFWQLVSADGNTLIINIKIICRLQADIT